MGARRLGLAAVYAAAATIALVPAGLYVSQMTLLRLDQLVLVAGSLFFNPFTLLPTSLAVWFAIIARRLVAGSGCVQAQVVFVERFAALVGAGLCVLGYFGVRQAEASAARGGGLLSGFAYLPLVAAAYLFTVAVASWAVRRGPLALTGARRATGREPAERVDPRS
jgi:hypothetical protein